MLANGTKESTVTTGTGALTIAAVPGFVRFSDKHGNSADYPFPYTITDASGAPIEGGIGYLSSATTLVRAKVLWTYAASVHDDTAPSTVALAAGTKYVVCAMAWQMLHFSQTYGMQYPHSTGAYRAIFNALSRTDTSGSNAWTNFDRMHYWPVLIDEGADCSGFVISGCSNASAYALAAGLYTVRADGLPGAAIATTGKVTPVNSSAPQVFSFVGANVAVLPGAYYIGAMVTNVGLTFDKERNRPFLLGSERGQLLPGQMLTENIASGWTNVPASAGTPGFYAGLADHMLIALKVAP